MCINIYVQALEAGRFIMICGGKRDADNATVASTQIYDRMSGHWSVSLPLSLPLSLLLSLLLSLSRVRARSLSRLPSCSRARALSLRVSLILARTRSPALSLALSLFLHLFLCFSLSLSFSFTNMLESYLTYDCVMSHTRTTHTYNAGNKAPTCCVHECLRAR